MVCPCTIRVKGRLNQQKPIGAQICANLINPQPVMEAHRQPGHSVYWHVSKLPLQGHLVIALNMILINDALFNVLQILDHMAPIVGSYHY